jgi:hypothetical protein
MPTFSAFNSMARVSSSGRLRYRGNCTDTEPLDGLAREFGRQSGVALAADAVAIRITTSMEAAARSQHNDSLTGFMCFLILASLLAARDISQAMGSMSYCKF